MDKPVTLVANWRSEIKLLAVGLIAGVILVFTAIVLLTAKRRKPLPPPPPPPAV